MKPEITPDDAKRALRAEYYSDVKSRAEDLKQRIESGEITSHEALNDAIWEECDGSSWVIYTANAYQVLFVSDNESAYFDEGLGDGSELISSDGLKIEMLAFFALRVDLQETLETIGIDYKYKFGTDDEGNEGNEGDEEEREEGEEA